MMFHVLLGGLHKTWIYSVSIYTKTKHGHISNNQKHFDEKDAWMEMPQQNIYNIVYSKTDSKQYDRNVTFFPKQEKHSIMEQHSTNNNHYKPYKKYMAMVSKT